MFIFPALFFTLFPAYFTLAVGADLCRDGSSASTESGHRSDDLAIVYSPKLQGCSGLYWQ